MTVGAVALESAALSPLKTLTVILDTTTLCATTPFISHSSFCSHHPFLTDIETILAAAL